MKKQKLAGRAVAVYIYTDWCTYCTKFKDEILQSPDVTEYLDGLIKVRINPDHGQAERKLADELENSGYPDFRIIPDGKDEIIRIPYYKMTESSRFIGACKDAEGKGIIDGIKEGIIRL